MKIDKIIRTHVLRAAQANELAHRSCNAYSYYKAKERHYSIALKILKKQKHSAIKYFEKTTGDQNGFPSVVIYFEWKENGRIVQLSFHKPLHSKVKVKKIYKGTPTEWTQIENAKVLALLKKSNK